MGTFNGNDTYEESIHYVDSGDPAEGGFNGVSNKARIQLANRTTYVKNRIDEHHPDKTNPHKITKADIGLGNVSNSLQLSSGYNLGDMIDAIESRANLGVYDIAAINNYFASKIEKANNLSEITGKYGRRNLDIYSGPSMQEAINTKSPADHSHDNIVFYTQSGPTIEVEYEGHVEYIGRDDVVIYFRDVGILIQAGNGRCPFNATYYDFYYRETFNNLIAITYSEVDSGGRVGIDPRSRQYFRLTYPWYEGHVFRYLAIGTKSSAPAAGV